METMDKQVILVVDDEPSVIKMISNVLKRKNLSFQEAMDCSMALESASRNLPDLILLDVIMPGVNGFETCRRLKKIKDMEDVPVIFITGMGDDESKLKGFEVGGVDYIVKPIRTPELLARVNAHLGTRSLQRQLELGIELLREQNMRFQDLENAAFDGICIHEKGTILGANDTLTSMFGYLPGEMTGRSFFEFIAREDRDGVKQKLMEDEEDAHVFEGMKKDGSLFPMEVRGKNTIWRRRDARVSVVRDLSRQRMLEEENRALHLGLDKQNHLGELVGGSLAMRRVFQRIVQAAGSADSVVVYGETGSGKELAAKTIFELSPSHNRRFIAVNCGAIQENLFEAQFFGFCKGAFTGAHKDTPGYFDSAREGTLFLDEVGELSPIMQAKLLRVLENGEYIPVGTVEKKTADVRIIAATNRELRELIKNKGMREDFFHRIHVIALEMPPLRARVEDIPLLADHFLRQRKAPENSKSSIPGELMDRFMEHDWSGNVRELFNELRRWLATGEVELKPGFSEERDKQLLSEGRTYSELMEDFERRVFTEALALHSGNRTRTADSIGIPRKTLQRKIKKYDL